MGFSAVFYVWLLALTATVWGKTVSYRLTLTWATNSPDGFARKQVLVNGKFPGPRLVADQGDTVRVLVVNSMPMNTSMHFHGIEQLKTLWSDGVPGVTQRNIKPGESFLYKWTATEYGSYWYHAHSRSQIDDGLYGPILIRPRSGERLPFSGISTFSNTTAVLNAFRQSRPMMVGDWNHATSSEAWEVSKASGVELICPDSILVNGKGSVTCPTPEELADPGPIGPLLGDQKLTPKGCLPPDHWTEGDFPHDYTKLPDSYFYTCKSTQGPREVVQVNSGDSWQSFDFISSAGFDTLCISIDEHPLWVYAVDGRFVEPYQAHALVIDPGARYSVMVRLDKPRGRQYTIRVNNQLVNQVLTGGATLSYQGQPVSTTPSKPYIDRFAQPLSSDVIMFTGAEARPFPAVVPSTTIDRTFILDVGRFGASYLWTVNGRASYPESAGNQDPLLFYPASAHPDYTIQTRNNTWVDLVFRATPFNPPHPIHKHSNKAFVIGRGDGEFNYATVGQAIAAMPQNFNLRNPLIRDTWIPPPAIVGPTWTVVRYHVVNPGPSLLHCHMQPHLEGGMALAIMDGIDAWPRVPGEYLNGNGITPSDDLSVFVNP